jgi:hypothetical protein
MGRLLIAVGGISVRNLMFALLLLVALAPPAWAEMQSTKDPSVNRMLSGLTDANILTMRCDVPGIQPRVTVLKRTYTPSSTTLIDQFLGGRTTLIGDGQSVVNPIWGKGTRYKSGSIIYALPGTEKGQRNWDIRTLPKLESVPAFLDVYPQGFLYTNNVPHKTVYATDVKVKGAADADISYRKLYTEKEGQAAVEQMLPNMVGSLPAPKGFRKKISQLIQTFGERLYVYRASLEHVTSYTVRKASGGKDQVVEKPIAVPVMDVYTHVLLDGDKVLAGMEHFWDSNLAATGAPKEALQASMAVMKAREWLIKRYNNKPPLYNVSALRLGYIQDRKNPTQLVPAWLFDAWYVAPIPNGAQITENAITNTTDPFAVNALTGEVIDL